MALTFSYKLVQADSTATTKVKGNKKSTADSFNTSSKGRANKSSKAGVALDNDFVQDGMVSKTAGQSIEIYSNGTLLDQARTFWVEVYATESDTSKTNVTLESLDMTLDFKQSVFSSVNDFQYSDAFDLMRSKSQTGNVLTFAQGSADNLKTKSGNQVIGKGNNKTTVNADQIGTGIELSSTEQFVGRIEVEVNDALFEDVAATAGTNRKSAGNIGDYITLNVNKDETVLVTKGDGAKNSIETLRDYAGGHQVIDGNQGDGYTGPAAAPLIEYVSGDFASNVSLAFDTFRTQLATTTGEYTNLVRKGQAIATNTFEITNVGEAGLTDINMIWDETANNGVSVEFHNAVVVSSVTGSTTTHDITKSGSSYTFGDGEEAQLERGERDDATGGVYNNTDKMTIDYTATITGEAGTVAKVDFTGLQMTSSGESNFNVFEENEGVVKNVITYLGDVSHDGKVGMLDLAVLNEAKRVEDATGVVNADANADHLGGIDILDLGVLAADWGKTLWATDGTFTQQGDGANQITKAQVSAQTGGLETDQAWAGSQEFLDEGTLANNSNGTTVELPFQASDTAMALASSLYD